MSPTGYAVDTSASVQSSPERTYGFTTYTQTSKNALMPTIAESISSRRSRKGLRRRTAIRRPATTQG
jgi:hypothetical protein